MLTIKELVRLGKTSDEIAEYMRDTAKETRQQEAIAVANAQYQSTKIKCSCGNLMAPTSKVCKDCHAKAVTRIAKATTRSQDVRLIAKALGVNLHKSVAKPVIYQGGLCSPR